ATSAPREREPIRGSRSTWSGETDSCREAIETRVTGGGQEPRDGFIRRTALGSAEVLARRGGCVEGHPGPEAERGHVRDQRPRRPVVGDLHAAARGGQPESGR